jgi:hypothetical protein
MSRTGICPREVFHMQVLGLALAGMVFSLGPSAWAKDYDPLLPRTEEVLDSDGSVWKVLIVPRPLYEPGLSHQATAMHMAPQDQRKSDLPPAPSEDPAPQTYEAAPQDAPAPEDKIEEAPAKENEEEPAKEEEPKEAKDPSDNPFGVEIVPRFSYPVLPPSAACLPSDEEGAVRVNPWDYALVYHSLPFVRSEYIANPSYRHEAAMEILFGQLRPTVVHKHPGQPRPHETQFPFENDIIRPYSYYSMGPGGGYGRGPLPFAAPGAYGVNYNFYWPMPTVYRQY